MQPAINGAEERLDALLRIVQGLKETMETVAEELTKFNKRPQSGQMELKEPERRRR